MEKFETAYSQCLCFTSSIYQVFPDLIPHKVVVEHITQMKGRIAKLVPLVKEQLQRAQEAQNRVYNRSAKLSSGLRTSWLCTPTVESSFLAKWHRLYKVKENVCEVNYKKYTN